ncbi:MAG: ribosome biogenesis/translation initiation ATPase RLI, partial [Thermoplasmata archaeon]
DAIKVINLPSELDEKPIHRYGKNAFTLYGLPAPEPGKVTGVLGANGIGKTTSVQILSGEITPNLGEYEDPPDFDEVIEGYRGTAVQNFLERLDDRSVTTAQKPQSIDLIPKTFEGRTGELLAEVDERGAVDEILEKLSVEDVKDQPINTLSGGELQRVAIAATLARDAEFYFLDEVTPYLDIGQRTAAARLIREFSDEERSVLVIDHDLAVLDMITDRLHVVYGEPGAFGVVTPPKSTKTGINQYLKGYLKNENMRIRSEPIMFEEHAPKTFTSGRTLVSYPEMKKSYSQDGFSLRVESGEISRNEVLGVLGPNGIGKTTFAKLIAGELTPDKGRIDESLKVSYKRQYVELDEAVNVMDHLYSVSEDIGSSFWQTEIAEPLQLDQIKEQDLKDLSGGEKQRVAIADCLSKDADLFLLDEPSAHLDVEQRVLAARAIRRYSERKSSPALVIDHDIYMIDLISDRLLVFDGVPGEDGHAGEPVGMREGMNEFLRDLEVTFRRDPDSGRPRINKPDSRKDREQKRSGEYYYV